MESSRTRDRTHISCIGRWILNDWTTREVLPRLFSSPVETGERQECSGSFFLPLEECVCVCVCVYVCELRGRTKLTEAGAISLNQIVLLSGSCVVSCMIWD